MGTQTAIDVGTIPNDGTGDPLRTGGITLNSNIVSVDARMTGFIADGDTGTPLALTGGVWTDIPNDTLGFGNNTFPPAGVTVFVDGSTGYLDLTQLDNGDAIILRLDFLTNPATNNQALSFRIEAGIGGGLFTLEARQSRMAEGSGIDYHNIITLILSVFDDNVRLNPVKLQAKTSGSTTLENVGTVVQGIMRAETA